MFEPFSVVHVLQSRKEAWVIAQSLSTSVAVRYQHLPVSGFATLTFVKLGAGVPVTSPLLYSAGHTDDTRQALMYIAKRYPKAPLLGLGFSLGANVVTRYLAEEGTQTRLHAACVLACVSFIMQHTNTKT